MRKTKSSVQTTAQSLGSLIKSARDIMRKDKGLSGDLDRLPMLTWIMFLKFLDDLELQRETEADLAGKKFKRAIDPPYRWRDWAANPAGITGNELMAFVNNEEAVLPDQTRGPGLFAYLRSLTGREGGDRRDVTDPKLGETILDPACGTGGFLVDAFQHLEKQCKTVEDRQLLQKRSIFGGEPKPLPYLLAQMNLLLHGLESPQISPSNSLAVRITDIGEKDRVDIILTNPPFGGEEERGILANFPSDKQTAETALLFLQLIMRKIRRGPKPGRAAVVAPNGTLFGDGVCARIKEALLKEFNLHTIVRLPNGVFAPYTNIPTNILFFDRSGPTKEVWYYEQPLPEGRKNYTKTAPIQFEEFGNCMKWWNKREENERAWKIPAKQLLEYNDDGSLRAVNLDRKNPRAKEDITHLPPDQLAADILKKEQRIAEIMGKLREMLAAQR